MCPFLWTNFLYTRSESKRSHLLLLKADKQVVAPRLKRLCMNGVNDHQSILFRVWTLGTFRVERRTAEMWEPIAEKAWGRSPTFIPCTKSLLCFLLTAHKRTVTRMSIMQRLWSQDIASSESYSYRANARLRALLKTPAGHSLLRTTGERLLLADQASIWVDADHAEALVKEAETIGPTQPAAIPLLEEASDLFQRGRFLEQEDGTWCIGRRGEIERLACRCHHWVADAYLAAKDDKAAEAIANLLLRDDPLDETGRRILLLSLHRQGHRREAVQAYQEAKDLYQQQGLPIPEEIEALSQSIQGTGKHPHREERHSPDAASLQLSDSSYRNALYA